LSIGLVDAQRLKVRPYELKLHYLCKKKKRYTYIKFTNKPLLKVEKAHGFAITSLAFNLSGKYLASAGADNGCRVMMIPKQAIQDNRGKTIFFFFFIIDLKLIYSIRIYLY
jgi:hypothetical protein